MWNLDQQVSVHMPVIAQWYAIFTLQVNHGRLFLVVLVRIDNLLDFAF